MPLQIPTTKQIKESFIANFESILGEVIPVNRKAFLRVLSAVEALSFTSLYKYAQERVRQNLALTASGQDLETLGSEYGVDRKPATFEQATVEIEVDNPDIVFNAGLILTGDNNEQDYTNDTEIISTGKPTVALNITASRAGTDSALNVGDTLTLQTVPAGSSSTAVVVNVTNVAVDIETEESYRRRVLNEIRTVGGGGNSADYRRWAEETTNVFRAFPYAGKPYAWRGEYTGLVFTASSKRFTTTESFEQLNLEPNDWVEVIGTVNNDGVYRVKTVTTTNIEVYEDLTDETVSGSTEVINVPLPGDRTVYIEADSTFDPDGIPNQAILDDARDHINTDPETGIDRPPLGEIDDTLYVEPINRIPIYVEVRGLTVDETKEADAKAAIESSVSDHLRGLTPYVHGLDPEIDRDNRISDMTISKIVSDALDSFGGFATGVGVGLEEGVFISSYQLSQGELAKLGTLTYD